MGITHEITPSRAAKPGKGDETKWKKNIFVGIADIKLVGISLLNITGLWMETLKLYAGLSGNIYVPGGNRRDRRIKSCITT